MLARGVFESGRDMDDEVDDLIQRWIIAFCEVPVMVDPDLMRIVLADVERTAGDIQKANGRGPDRRADSLGEGWSGHGCG